MVSVNDLLDKRFKKEKTKKMDELAKRTSSGQLSSFSGVFKVEPLSAQEKSLIEEILIHYSEKKGAKSEDLSALSTITSELKAINNQAIILHGERIKKAQEILKRYKEGAFTSWLMMTYGNRQTPYNFLQYYEFYNVITPSLREKINEMPKQAIYTLAARDGEQDKKEAFIEKYQGEPKHIVLEQIRKIFPLASKDKRRQNLSRSTTTTLRKLLDKLRISGFSFKANEKAELNMLLSQIMALVNQEALK